MEDRMISRRGYTCDLAAGQGTSSNKIRTYPAGSVEPWNTRTGTKIERERDTQINQSFPFVSPLWGRRNIHFDV